MGVCIVGEGAEMVGVRGAGERGGEGMRRGSGEGGGGVIGACDSWEGSNSSSVE